MLSGRPKSSPSMNRRCTIHRRGQRCPVTGMCNRTTSTMTGGARRGPLRVGVIAGLVALFSIVIPVLVAADDSLPSRKQVLLLSASLWESYRWHIVAVVGLIGAQGVLIGALLLQHRRRRRAETVVRERLDFETLVSDLSATFVGLRGAEVDEGIARGLRRVGEHLGLDNALILEFSADDRAMHLTHLWTAPGVPPPGPPMDLARFPWSVERVRRGEIVRFSALDELPDAAAVDREAFAALGIKSVVGIPLAAAGTAMGVLTLSTLRRAQEWSDDLVQRLEFVGGIFSSALLRQRGEIELRKLRRDLTHVGRVATMGELTASIAHELNQPLTAILSNAQVAERLIDSGVDAKDIREIVSDIVADDKRAIDVIHRLRALFKKDDTNQRPLDVNALIQDVVSLVRSDATTRGGVHRSRARGRIARGPRRSHSAPAGRPQLDHEWPRCHADQRRSSPRHRDPRQRRRRRTRLGERPWQRDRRVRAAAGLRAVLHDEASGPRDGTLDRPVPGRGSRWSAVGTEQFERRRDLLVHAAALEGEAQLERLTAS